MEKVSAQAIVDQLATLVFEQIKKQISDHVKKVASESYAELAEQMREGFAEVDSKIDDALEAFADGSTLSRAIASEIEAADSDLDTRIEREVENKFELFVQEDEFAEAVKEVLRNTISIQIE